MSSLSITFLLLFISFQTTVTMSTTSQNRSSPMRQTWDNIVGTIAKKDGEEKCWGAYVRHDGLFRGIWQRFPTCGLCIRFMNQVSQPNYHI